MKGKGNHRFNIGGASIILILVVFALTVFALLSIRASYHELKLAKMTRKIVSEYYTADGKAEDMLMQVYDAVEDYNKNPHLSDTGELTSVLEMMEDVYMDIEQSTDTEQSTNREQTMDKNLVNYRVKMNDFAVLKVVLKLNLEQGSGVNLKVISWKMVTKEQGDYTSNENAIWDGIIAE